MWALIISLLCLALIAMIAGAIRNRRLNKKIANGELDELPDTIIVDTECCGQHHMCEKDSLLAAVSKRVEYYDDEELDLFIGRAPNEYGEDEVELFREVFYTMQDIEVAGWVRSLQLRGIGLPDSIKDEVFLVVTERRIHTATT